MKYKLPEYKSWIYMKARCYNYKNTNYNNYGGRGIKICDRWLNSFENFYLDMGPKPDKYHSLDRIDVNGNYEPSNCRWADRRTQNINSRKRKNCTSKYRGVSFCNLTGKWKCQIYNPLLQKQCHIGRYNNELEAANAYDKQAIKLYGKLANINGLTK